ncbi:hypothetical protein [Saccharibacillus deserti]|uniref:hypothetical protein n=1 Tax=Saccharibacillus deserti TaxID=1634444 RepID=UPI0015532434|nr:hypothetical protein [Saccharibacillus deserti]
MKHDHVLAATLHLADGQELYFDIRSAGYIDHNPGLTWTIFVPRPGTGTEERLAQLLAGTGLRRPMGKAGANRRSGQTG